MSITIQPGTFQYILAHPQERAYLRAGDADAATLKESLRTLGFAQEPLEEAVRSFQLQHNREHPESPLKVDGKAGQNTLGALYAAPAGGTPGQLHDSVFGRAKFLGAQNDVAAMLEDPPAASTKITSSDPVVIEHQLRGHHVKHSGGPAVLGGKVVNDAFGHPMSADELGAPLQEAVHHVAQTGGPAMIGGRYVVDGSGKPVSADELGQGRIIK